MSSKKKNIQRQNLIQLLLGLMIIALINIIGHHYFLRFDLTSEKRYTLSPTTKDLIRSFDDFVTFRVYLDGDFPAGFRKLQRETREMLNEFRAYNPLIQYEFIDPAQATDARNRNDFYAELHEKGIEPTSVRSREGSRESQQLIFPGALVNYKATQEEAVNLLQSQMGAGSEQQINASIQALEYNLAAALMRLKTREKDKIAFLHGYGGLEKIDLEGAEKVLSRFYDVEHFVTKGRINSLLDRRELPGGRLDVRPRFKALIIARPTQRFTNSELFLIDQYLMHGGRLLWFVDPVMTDMDSLATSPRTLAMPGNLNLDDIMSRYGVRLNRNLIQDLRSGAIPVNTQPAGLEPKFEMFPWPYFPILLPASDHPIVKNINGVKAEFASSLDTIRSPSIKKTFLLQSSEYSRTLRTPAEVTLEMVNRQPDPRRFRQGPFNVAVLLEGTFVSAFEHRLTPEMYEAEEMAIRNVSDTSRVIVVADGDIIKNAVSSRQGGSPRALPLGMDKFTGQQFGNKEFVLNAVNYLCDDTGLLEVRAKDLEIRILDRTEIMENKARWQMVNVALPIVFILIMSIIWNLIRKRKYTK